MGLFIAKISRGRTIREFIAGVLIVPTLIAILWFTTFGGTGLYIELFGAGGLSELINSQVELAIFAMLAELPFSFFTNIVAIILIAIFFITSADSASFVLGSMTSNGDPEPKLSVKLVWGLLIAGAASVLLFSGGGGLRALQTASIVAALPFTIIMIFMVVCITMILSKDKKLDRRIKKKRDLYEMKDEFRDELTHGVYQEVKTEFSKEFIEDVKDDVYEEVKNEFYEDVKDDLYDEMKDDLYDEVKDEIYDDVKDDFYKEFKDKVQDEVKKEIIEEINDEHPKD